MTQEVRSLTLRIESATVVVNSNSYELIDRLEKDFSYFRINNDFGPCQFKIKANLGNIDLEIPDLPVTRKSKNSITYDSGHIRYNDYYSKLLSIYDYKNETGKIYSPSIEKLHEITYLLILSRTAKYLDLLGIHKVHASAFIYNNVCCVGMMNSGVGKSTVLLELLKDKEVIFLSDDTPLVSTKGDVKEFPLRIGLSKTPNGYDFLDTKKNFYSLDREEYGLKNLICINALKNKIAGDYERVIFFEGSRGHRLEPVIKRRSVFMFWASLQKHMVIGIGLPIIFEYFWEKGFVDFVVKTKIFILRQRAALNLVKRHDYFHFYMSDDPVRNAEMIKVFLKKKA